MSNMDEVFKYQESISDSIVSANDKFQLVEQTHNIDQVLSRVKDYHEKLITVKRSLLLLKDKSSKLRRRANKILEEKNREDIERQRSRERREMLEKHLEPVVNTRRD